jgi:hypothetical protein
MNYRIRLGVPDFRNFHNDLISRAKSNELDKGEIRLFKRISKTIGFLSVNPKHNSLCSHEIDDLTRRYSKITGQNIKVWQSYLENNTPAAGRIFWVYGPAKGEITIIALEPHPEDQKKSAYSKVDLSFLPPL